MKQVFCAVLFLMPLSLYASKWIYVTDDISGMNYINPSNVRYNNRYESAKFLLLTNEYVAGTKNLSGTSLITDYEIYCNPSPKLFNRYKITTYTKPWGKGKISDSFRPGTGDWQIEISKEVEISEFICKDSRIK